jgi:CheY-like chemotaxis protein
MFVHDSTAELWSDSTVKCVVVPHDHQLEVELRNADGSAFLRKTVQTRQAAMNEAEYLRLLLSSSGRSAPSRGLKPFALVIEDDRDDFDALDALLDGLRASGMRALGCRSGAEGLCLGRDLAPDLIVVDYGLPDFTGAEVCHRLRETPETAGTPILAVTASPEAFSVEVRTADAVLTKPCPIDTLVAAARLLVGHLASGTDVSS